MRINDVSDSSCEYMQLRHLQWYFGFSCASNHCARVPNLSPVEAQRSNWLVSSMYIEMQTKFVIINNNQLRRKIAQCWKRIRHGICMDFLKTDYSESIWFWHKLQLHRKPYTVYWVLRFDPFGQWSSSSFYHNFNFENGVHALLLNSSFSLGEFISIRIRFKLFMRF